MVQQHQVDPAALQGGQRLRRGVRPGRHPEAGHLADIGRVDLGDPEVAACTGPPGVGRVVSSDCATCGSAATVCAMASALRIDCSSIWSLSGARKSPMASAVTPPVIISCISSTCAETHPTVAQIPDKGVGKVLYDMRTPEGSRQALGGLYPSSSLYMNTDWVNGHKDTVQKLANAFVKTLRWMSTHTPQEIAAKMPADYAQGGAELYAESIKATLPMFTADGVMPADGPTTVESVLKAFNPNLQHTTVDLSRTYTTEFVTNVR
ncbi:hypothetical protein [Streptomyces sp. NBC_01477]|uniref:hypothetical protein n=1 Tax=Streptomyces sp. NBC_01477 TaxID=2976015 RepID=UPI002E31A6FA|nr:hypothetical protein [Streptomyces sp. NBC_01477]